MAEFALGLAMLIVLLAAGWSGSLRDFAYSTSFQSYSFAVLLYVMMLAVITKVVALPVDYYSFNLEHRYQLSNQKARDWIWDEVKGFLVTAVFASILVELLYFVIRRFPQYWWLIAWIGFLGVVVLLAQLAPVVLFPIFYKFEPLQDEELKSRLV